MRRPVLALALLGAAVVVTAQQASTAGNALPAETTAVYRATTASGATLVSTEYAMTGSTITGVTTRLRKTNLLSTTVVTASFGGDAPRTCVGGLITIVSLTLNIGEADYTCTGFAERADRPRELTIRAS